MLCRAPLSLRGAPLSSPCHAARTCRRAARPCRHAARLCRREGRGKVMEMARGMGANVILCLNSHKVYNLSGHQRSQHHSFHNGSMADCLQSHSFCNDFLCPQRPRCRRQLPSAIAVGASVCDFCRPLHRRSRGAAKNNMIRMCR